MDLPAPVSPTKATVCPAGMRRSTPLRASSSWPSAAPYTNDTFSNAMSPRSEGTGRGSSWSAVEVGSRSSSWIRPSETVACW